MVRTPFEMLGQVLGLSEVPGPDSHPLILAALKNVQNWPTGDEVPWCSAFLHGLAELWDLPRPSKAVALRARSWLPVGAPIELVSAQPGTDIVIVKQQAADPGPEVLDFRGHVGMFAGWIDNGAILIRGGNQGNKVSDAPFKASLILGVRRLFDDPLLESR